MDNPFPSTVVADWGFLDSTSERSSCATCKKSRKYYCYTCYVALPHIESRIPKVQLPVEVNIIKHPSEIDGKSTSVHAAVLAPDDVKVFTYPCIPDYDPSNAVLVFPCEESIGLEDLRRKFEAIDKPSNQAVVSSNSANKEKNISDSNERLSNFEQLDGTKLETSKCGDIPDKKATSHKRPHEKAENSEELPMKRAKVVKAFPFKKVIFIDSTWNQTRNIVTDERLKDLTKVELKSQLTNFWRCQEGIPKTYLSTIEAIYYFMRDFHNIFIKTEYNHEYDNLLFFFCFMYNKIRSAQNNGKTKKN